MHPELRSVSEHIHHTGLGVLAQAQRNAFYTGMGADNMLDEGIFAVLQAAHSAELLMKAAIAREHPLLIFAQLPKQSAQGASLLTTRDVFENARTIQFSDVPDRLWATTGYRIQRRETYDAFGRLRNGIQHFMLPREDLRSRTIAFVYDVIDPLIGYFWDEYAVMYVDLQEHEQDFFKLLVQHRRDFRIPECYRSEAQSALAHAKSRLAKGGKRSTKKR